MSYLYFVRHGETENNRKNLMNGSQVDSPLTSKGVADAKSVGEFLKAVNFSSCYSSPQKRAIITTELILQQNQEEQPGIEIIDNLHEFDMGDWDGVPIEQLPQNQDLDNYLNHPDRWDGQVTGGESYQHLINRGRQAIATIVATHPVGNILIVSHGVLLQTTLTFLRGYSLAQVRQGSRLANCSVTLFSAEKGQYQCLDWGHKDFLTPLNNRLTF